MDLVGDVGGGVGDGEFGRAAGPNGELASRSPYSQSAQAADLSWRAEGQLPGDGASRSGAYTPTATVNAARSSSITRRCYAAAAGAPS